MKPQLSLPHLLSKTALFFSIAIVMNANITTASEYPYKQHNKFFQNIKFSKNLNVRGFKISDGIYMGQAKVAGKYGFGVVVDNKKYSWGINNKGVSITKSF